MSNFESNDAPAYAPFFGYMGATAAQVFTVFGAAYGTAKSSVGIFNMGVMRPEMIPVIMAGIIGIYGLVISMVLKNKIKENYDLKQGFAHLAAGLTCGLCGLGAGYSIGIVGDSGVRGTAQQPRLFVGMILILIFSEIFKKPGFEEMAALCQKWKYTSEIAEAAWLDTVGKMTFGLTEKIMA